MNLPGFSTSDYVKPGPAPCQVCGAQLRFFIGGLGETLETCENRACENAIPHRPIAVAPPLPAYRKKQRRMKPR